MSEPVSVLAHYPSQYAPVEDAPEPISGGFSGAKVYRVESEAGRFALRRWPPGGLPPERLRGLHRLLRCIRDGGLEVVAVPVVSQGGSTLVHFHGADWQLEPWLPGTADYHAAPSDEKLAAALRTLARWHTAAARFEPQGEEATWFASGVARSPAVRERLRRIQTVHAGLPDLESTVRRSSDEDWIALAGRVIDALQRFGPRVERDLALLAEQRYPLQPCLRDVWHDHVLFTGDEVTGLIDPSACRTESVASDIARLAGSLVGNDMAGWNRALEAYEQVCPLSLEERALVPVLDRSGVLLSALAWIERRFLEGERLSKRHCARAEGFLQRLESMNW